MNSPEILQFIIEFNNGNSRATSEVEVCYHLTQKIIAHFGLEDCVVYLMDDATGLLHQVNTQDAKNVFDFDISDPITIRPGYGIVGTAFINQKHELINDTRLDPRYLVDERLRLSELAVPIIIGDKSIGVIDSEHSQVSFYNEEHLVIFQILASIAANRIEQIRAITSARIINTALEVKSNELLKKNDELEALNAQMDELIYSITHDFRTPILASIGITDMMIQDGAVKEELHPMLKSSLNKLDNILQSVHLFFRVKRRLVAISEFSLTDMVSSSLHSMTDALQPFQVINEIDPKITVATDSFRLRLCLDQLIKNSTLFAYRPNQENFITFSTMISDHQVTLRMQDSGPGIPAHVIDSSTQLLRRGNTAGKGLGLGLAIVREAAQTAGMELQYRNTPPNGLLVEIKLPMNLKKA